MESGLLRRIITLLCLCEGLNGLLNSKFLSAEELICDGSGEGRGEGGGAG